MSSNRSSQAGILDACREGMTVVDADGEELGTIELIGPPHSDDERTVNNELTEQYDGSPDLPFPAPGVGGAVLGPTRSPIPAGMTDRGPARVGPVEPDVSPDLATKLLHSGYIK